MSTVDRVAVVSIEGADERNEIDRATATELDRAWRRLDTDPDVDVAVLTGTRRVFCGGRDADADADVRPLVSFVRSSIAKPVIAAIEGPCLSLGFEMALWCDLRVSGISSVFGFDSRGMRRPIMEGGTQRLGRLIGPGLAAELVLTGRPMDAEEAHAVGLVNLVVADGSATTTAVEIAERIARHPQGVVRANRQALREGLDAPLSEGLELERRLAVQAMETRRRNIRRMTREAEWSGHPFRLELPAAGAGPAVMVLPDRWGLDEFTISVSERLLDAGYVVVTVPLYDRPDTEEEAQAALAGLDGDVLATRLRTAVEGVRTHPAVDGPIALLGFGVGGGLALWMAGESPAVQGCVTFGAVARWPQLQPQLSSAKAAFLGHNGERDDLASPHTAYRLEMAMRDHGLDATFETYRGMDGEFYRSSEESEQAAFDLAWSRTQAFLQRTL